MKIKKHTSCDNCGYKNLNQLEMQGKVFCIRCLADATDRLARSYRASGIMYENEDKLAELKEVK